MENQYKYFKCVLDGKEFLSRAKRPECPQCRRHKVNMIEKPTIMADQAAAKADAIIEKKSEVQPMPKDKDEEAKRKPDTDGDEDEEDGFF